MSMFGNMISGAVGAGIAATLKDFIEKQGGVSAIASRFQQHGLADTVQSWIGTGHNLPVSAEEIQKVLGSGPLQAIAAKLGISAEELSGHLAQHLPQVIDKMTPNGKLEEAAA